MVSFAVNNQFQCLLNDFQGNCFNKIHTQSQDHPALVRLSALPIAFAHNLINVASRVSLIVESVLKGLGNIFGSLALEQCSFSRGMNYLVIQAPKHLILLPFTIVAAAFRTLTDTFRLMSEPVVYSASILHSYDPSGHQTHVFNCASEDYEKKGEDPLAIRQLAQCYEQGIGTERDAQKAHDLYLKAANAGDVESMWLLANLLLVTDQVRDAMPWLERVANNGNVKAMTTAAEIYENSDMFVKALDYYLKAAEAGDLNSMVKYALLRFDIKYKMLPFDENVHTPQKASELLTHAALNHSGDAVAIFAFMVFMKCANDPYHPQQWDTPIHDHTKEEMLNNLTPDMLKAFIKGMKGSNIRHCEAIQQGLIPPQIREGLNTKYLVSHVNSVLLMENIERNIEKLKADHARRAALYDAASRTQNPIFKVMALLI